jgi:FkbM family methyltransferase
MKLKNLARSICPPVIWQVAAQCAGKKNDITPHPLNKQYYGLQELDRKLEKFLDFDNGFFIEIGGWDGVTCSNSLYFERFRNWRGILIEPSPNEFLKCRRNRPDANVFCCACVPFDFTGRFLPMTYCASMTIAHSSEGARNGIRTIDEHVTIGRSFLDPSETVYEFGALAKPLTTLLDENDIHDEIDLLVLDLEGFEINVLKGIDFGRHAPKYICAEVWSDDEISDFLSRRGYATLSVLSDQGEHRDVLFAKT